MFLIFFSKRLISLDCHDYFLNYSRFYKFLHKKRVLFLGWFCNCWYVLFWSKVRLWDITWWRAFWLFFWHFFYQSTSHSIIRFVILFFFKEKLFNFVDLLFYFLFFLCVLSLIHVLWQFFINRLYNKLINFIKRSSNLLQIILGWTWR